MFQDIPHCYDIEHIYRKIIIKKILIMYLQIFLTGDLSHLINNFQTADLPPAYFFELDRENHPLRNRYPARRLYFPGS